MPTALRQVLLTLVAAAAVAAVGAAVWLLVVGGAYRPKLGLALMVVGALIALTGGTGISRFSDLDARAFLGAGPARDEATHTGALTGFGVFLLVSLPLFLMGGLVYGRG